MPITLVQNKLISQAGATTIVGSFNTLPTVGNRIILIANTLANTPGELSIADNQSGNSYGLDLENSGFNETVFWSAAVIGSAGTFTITVTDTQNKVATLFLMEFSGLDASPKDQTNTNLGISGTPNTGSTGITAQASELILVQFCASVLYGGTTATPDGLYTELNKTFGVTLGLEAANAYQIVAATGAYSETWTTDLSGAAWDAAIVTYKALVILPPGLGPAVGMSPIDFATASGALLSY